jgi:hypothetical protein
MVIGNEKYQISGIDPTNECHLSNVVLEKVFKLTP